MGQYPDEAAPNPSGRSLLNGENSITDLDKTEASRNLVRRFAMRVLEQRRYESLDNYVHEAQIQHDPDISDGIAALRSKLEAVVNDAPRLVDEQIHRVVAEENFVLCMSEGRKAGQHSGIYDLFRVADELIAECWNTVSPIAPRSEWRNDNGKF